PDVPWLTDVVSTEHDVPGIEEAGGGVLDGVLATIASPDQPLASFTAVIEWGDGSPISVGTITGTDASGALVTSGNREASEHTGASLFLVESSHEYADDGVYEGLVTII